MNKIKLKRGDKVRVIAGKDKGKEGKILIVDRKRSRVIVEGVNLIKKHTKPTQGDQKGGIVDKEAALDVSNVMLLHKGNVTRIGYKLEEVEKNGVKKMKKIRIAKTTGEAID